MELGEEGVAEALVSFDEIYRQADGASPLAEVGERLAAESPIDLRSYRGLRAPWNDWTLFVTLGRAWAAIVARVALEGGAS